MKTLKEQTPNKVTTVGKLVSVAMREGNTKNGKPYVSCKATVRVQQSYLGNEETSDINHSFFATKFTNSGEQNSAYDSIMQIANFNTIETAGPTGADTVRITGSSLHENSYMGRNGFVNGWDIQSRFINKAKAGEENSCVFRNNIVIIGKKPETDAEGEETGRLIVSGGIVQWGEVLDVLDFIVEDPNAAQQVDNAWEQGATFDVWGRVRVTVMESKKPAVSSSWGEDAPIEVSTRTVRELILTGGNPIDEEDFCWEPAEIKKGVNQRKARRDQMKTDAEAPKAAPAPAKKSYAWE